LAIKISARPGVPPVCERQLGKAARRVLSAPLRVRLRERRGVRRPLAGRETAREATGDVLADTRVAGRPRPPRVTPRAADSDAIGFGGSRGAQGGWRATASVGGFLGPSRISPPCPRFACGLVLLRAISDADAKLELTTAQSLADRGDRRRAGRLSDFDARGRAGVPGRRASNSPRPAG